MLREVEITDQFRVTVQQLEVCHKLVRSGREADSRSALILLDHVSEVVLHRIVQEEIMKDAFTRSVIPERYPPKTRAKIERGFHEKLEAVSIVVSLPEQVRATLKVLHSYRNAAQHQDKHNPSVLPILARLSFVATADLFARTAGGFPNTGVGGCDESVDWLKPYDLEIKTLWFSTLAKEIARKLKAGIRPKLDIVKRNFTTDISTRARAVQVSLDDLFEGDVMAANRMLKWYEFRRRHWALESKLSIRFRELRYKIASGNGHEVSLAEYEAAEGEFRKSYDNEFDNFVPLAECQDLDRIKDEVAKLPNEKSFRSVLKVYESLDRRLESLEESLTQGYLDMESAAEFESDRARGK